MWKLFLKIRLKVLQFKNFIEFIFWNLNKESLERFYVGRCINEWQYKTLYWLKFGDKK